MCSFFGKQAANTSSAARSRRVATRMSCTRSMSPVSSTPSACANTSRRADLHRGRGGVAEAGVGLQARDRPRLGHQALAASTSSRITPSRSPPRAIRSGRPSWSDTASSTQDARRAAAARARGRARTARATSAIGGERQHPHAPLERLVRQLGAHEAAQRGGGAAHRHGASRRRAARRPSNTPATCSRTASSSATDGGSRAQVAVGQEARADRGRTPTTPPLPSGEPTAISVDPPPTSTTAMVPVGRAGPGCGRRRRTTAAPPRSPDSTRSGMPDGLLHRVAQLVAVRRRCGWRRWPRPPAPWRPARARRARLCAAPPPPSPRSSPAGSRRPCRGPADAGERALGHQLAQRPASRLGHEQPGGVAADVDAAAGSTESA